jgi:hypothetical protein
MRSRVRSPTRSIIPAARMVWPEWCTKRTSVTRLAAISRWLSRTDRPGTVPVSEPRTSRRVSTATTNVAPNKPIASWLNRSESSADTMRGENWPMASCTTTSVKVSTTVVSETIEEAKTDRVVCAPLGVPVTLCWTRL